MRSLAEIDAEARAIAKAARERGAAQGFDTPTLATLNAAGAVMVALAHLRKGGPGDPATLSRRVHMSWRRLVDVAKPALPAVDAPAP